MESMWLYAIWTLKIAVGLSGLVAAVVLFGTLFGIVWDVCTRNGRRALTRLDSGMEVPVTRRFRLESWYGRLLRVAYGEDRAWIVWLRRMTRTVFKAHSMPAIPGDASEDMRLAAEVDYRRLRQEAYERSLALHSAPPYLQPFFPQAPRSNLCPTFWKVMFACYGYVLGVALRRAVVAGSIALWHAFTQPIVAAFRLVFQRFGRKIGYALAGSIYAAAVAFTMYITWPAADKIADLWIGSPMLTSALKASREQQRQETRLRLEQQYLRSCALNIQRDQHTTSVCTDENDTNEESFVKCAKNHFPVRGLIAELEQGDLLETNELVCLFYGERSTYRSTFSAGFGHLTEHFPTLQERETLGKRIAIALRGIFAKELAEEDIAYRKGLTEKRKRDAEALILARADLEEHSSSARILYARFESWCMEKDGAWKIVNWYGVPYYMTNATCTALAEIFEDQIDAAQSEIDAQRLRADWAALKKDAPQFGVFLISWNTIIVLLIIALPWVVWPVCKFCWKGVLAFWRLGWLVRFRAAIRQIWRDTWHLVRSFVSALWQHLCPFVEWE